MYTYAYPAYQESVEKPRFSGFGATEGARETIQTWKNRVTYVKADIATAKRAVAAVPSAMQALPLFETALMHANEAAAIIAVEQEVGQWSRFREEKIDAKLAEARESYDAARGMAMSLGAYNVPKMSTWTMSAPAGTKSAGTVTPPAGPGDAPAREVPPNVIIMGMDPQILIYGGLALAGLVLVTSLLRR
jgi:hypothetical protein